MKKETLHPDFFTFDDKRIIEIKPVMPIVTGVRKLTQTLGCLTPMMTIPMYTIQKAGSRKRKQMEIAYHEERLKKYNEVKKIYDKNIFLGTVFCAINGNKKATDPISEEMENRSCKITKIVIDDKEGIGYVCYKASDEHIEWVNRQNHLRNKAFEKDKLKNKKIKKTFSYQPLKPIASGKFGLITFLSAIDNYVRVIKNPNKPQTKK